MVHDVEGAVIVPVVHLDWNIINPPVASLVEEIIAKFRVTPHLPQLVPSSHNGSRAIPQDDGLRFPAGGSLGLLAGVEALFGGCSFNFW